MPSAKNLGNKVVSASWLAVFVLFGYRATFSVLLQPMAESMNWTVSQTSLGYSLMMTVYAVTAFFSGMIIDKWGTRPAYLIGSVCAALGFYVTSFAQSYFGYLIPYALFAGIGTGMLWVSSTVSVRKWYVGKAYASAWGIAFMGAPVAQVLLSLGVKQILVDMDWQQAMRGLAVVVFIALVLAAILAKKSPEDYDLEPFGLDKSAGANKSPELTWSVKQAFSKFAIWGTIIAFLTSMLAEFLIWSQFVSYFTTDVDLSLSSATNLYVAIGIAGIITMPLMGKIADKIVGKVGSEAKGRKIMLIFAPITGVIACGLLLLSNVSIIFGAISCVLFATYWAIEPGGAAGYAGAVYGSRKTFGKIWGLATLVVMGIGPAVGSFMGGFLFDISGSYLNSVFFAVGSFVVSAIVAALLPITVKHPSQVEKSNLKESVKVEKSVRLE